MLQKEILLDVVGTSGYRYEVLRSFSVERIEQGNEMKNGRLDELEVGKKDGMVDAARLGCAETKVATWDDLAFKLIILGWNVKHSTDIAKVLRKRSKPDKHGQGKGKRIQEPG
ncbi:hypothetical protein Tco_1505195 [Tanacetum coccineum]